MTTQEGFHPRITRLRLCATCPGPPLLQLLIISRPHYLTHYPPPPTTLARVSNWTLKPETCPPPPQGSARVIRCLTNQRNALSPVCRATLFDEEVRFSENIDFQFPMKEG